ncbi:MAG: glycosyltransferase [Clostridiales bacterium]|nr:glycosyltransferase [Clostridiales bacterium]
MEQVKAQPLVSVIIPVYNVEKYLARCLDSIVGQTYRNLEIILVNDGSTDHSEDICLQYAQSDPRIRLFTQKNQGLSAARNTGLDHMKGEYIHFVDSDDYISLYMIETLLDALLQYDVPLSVCNYLKVEDSDDNAALDMIPAELADFCKKVSRNEVFDLMGTAAVGKFVGAWGKLYSKKIFETMRYPVGRVYEDDFLFHRIYSQTDAVCYADLKLYAYRQSLNSITRENGVRCIYSKDFTDMALDRLAFFQQYGIEKYALRAKDLLASDSMCYLLTVTDKGLVNQYIAEIDEKAYQITGKKLSSFKWRLFKMSPGLYRLVKECCEKVRSSFKWALSKLSPKLYQSVKGYYRKIRDMLSKS